AASLLQVISEIEKLTGRKAELQFSDWRMGDQRWYVSDPRRAQRELHLGAFKPWRQGVADLVGWLADERGFDIPRAESRQSGESRPEAVAAGAA
ncbi:MAG TPA: hypothetical protein VD929_10890, partial [Caulobacteraceae bacterium]|nr:hypothetical protein [Caulobacteraceae bacterium]